MEESSKSIDSATSHLCPDSYHNTKQQTLSFAWGSVRKDLLNEGLEEEIVIF